jgi:hypothetical protein
MWLVSMGSGFEKCGSECEREKVYVIAGYEVLAIMKLVIIIESRLVSR